MLPMRRAAWKEEWCPQEDLASELGPRSCYSLFPHSPPLTALFLQHHLLPACILKLHYLFLIFSFFYKKIYSFIIWETERKGRMGGGPEGKRQADSPWSMNSAYKILTCAEIMNQANNPLSQPGSPISYLLNKALFPSGMIHGIAVKL